MFGYASSCLLHSLITCIVEWLCHFVFACLLVLHVYVLAVCLCVVVIACVSALCICVYGVLRSLLCV